MLTLKTELSTHYYCASCKAEMLVDCNSEVFFIATCPNFESEGGKHDKIRLLFPAASGLTCPACQKGYITHGDLLTDGTKWICTKCNAPIPLPPGQERLLMFQEVLRIFGGHAHPPQSGTSPSLEPESGGHGTSRVEPARLQDQTSEVQSQTVKVEQWNAEPESLIVCCGQCGGLNRFPEHVLRHRVHCCAQCKTQIDPPLWMKTRDYTDPDSLVIACADCGTQNRVTQPLRRDGLYRCGQCKAEIANLPAIESRLGRSSHVTIGDGHRADKQFETVTTSPNPRLDKSEFKRLGLKECSPPKPDPTPGFVESSALAPSQQLVIPGFSSDGGESFGINPDTLKITCSNCPDVLFGKPKIRIEGRVYCYKCAKAVEKDCKRKMESKLKEDVARYEERKAGFQKRRAAWEADFTKHIATSSELWLVNTFGNWLPLVMCYGVGFLAFYALENAPISLAGFVCAFLFGAYLLTGQEKIVERLRAEFSKRCPEPVFNELYPAREPVGIELLPPDGSKLKNKNFRSEILSRDDHRCHVCEVKPLLSVDLEVHHILPVSKGGGDEPTNLITLCKYHHDREDWFDHVRAYPSTLRITRRIQYVFPGRLNKPR